LARHFRGIEDAQDINAPFQANKHTSGALCQPCQPSCRFERLAAPRGIGEAIIEIFADDQTGDACLGNAVCVPLFTQPLKIDTAAFEYQQGMQDADGIQVADHYGNCEALDIALLQTEDDRENVDVQQLPFRPLEIDHRGGVIINLRIMRFALKIFREQCRIGPSSQKVSIRSQIGTFKLRQLNLVMLYPRGERLAADQNDVFPVLETVDSTDDVLEVGRCELWVLSRAPVSSIISIL
jgi:hypothetical protein